MNETDEKLRSCPFCGGKARLQPTDDEGNFKDESYLENPYSGVGYVIMHDTSNSTDCCPIATDSDSSQGSYIYASKEAAINAWNGRKDDDLTNYISKIMNIFYGSFINHNKELILIPKTNLYFYLGDVNTVDEVKYKLLEWCSRSCFKSMPYRYTKKNREYQDDVLRKVNECLDMEFKREQMELIYTKLGNCINHELTMKFISSGYDMKLLEER